VPRVVEVPRPQRPGARAFEDDDLDVPDFLK
jgi:hypothetical protein